ncbi:MAG TPA: hypothetical protein VKY24_07885 [Reyranella sp.]|nr:hypothetical protein [Reyranella sp.]
MAQSQRDAIAEAIDEVMSAEEDDAEGLCCTIEATNAQGESVTIQVMQDSLNISPYPSTDEPLSQLAACGAIEGFEAELEVVDWNPGVYATLGIDGLDTEQVAQLIDQVFVQLLGCDEENYTITATTEDLG